MVTQACKTHPQDRVHHTAKCRFCHLQKGHSLWWRRAYRGGSPEDVLLFEPVLKDKKLLTRQK